MKHHQPKDGIIEWDSERPEEMKALVMAGAQVRIPVTKAKQRQCDDLGAYEIMLPDSFDLEIFKERAAAGLDGYWAICVEDGKNFKRLKGVLLPDYTRVFVDIGFDEAGYYAYCAVPLNEKFTAPEVVKRVRKTLGGTKVWKDGVEVPA